MGNFPRNNPLCNIGNKLCPGEAKFPLEKKEKVRDFHFGIVLHTVSTLLQFFFLLFTRSKGPRHVLTALGNNRRSVT